MNDKSELVTLYSVYVSSIIANEQRRAQLATIYLSLFATGAAIFGVLKLDFIYFAVPGLMVSGVWLASIRYFRRLAVAKFKVIAELENELSYQPFAREWHFYKGSDSANGSQKKYFGLTHLDMMVPFLFFVIAAGYILIRLVSMLCTYWSGS